jgi:hypothetical protein
MWLTNNLGAILVIGNDTERVGIGTWNTNPSATLDIYNENGDALLLLRTLDYGEMARFTYDGNFGIGTPTPLAKLDVNGTLFIRPSTQGTCDSTYEGMIYYNSTTHKHYGCNSTSWEALY